MEGSKISKLINRWDMTFVSGKCFCSIIKFDLLQFHTNTHLKMSFLVTHTLSFFSLTATSPVFCKVPFSVFLSLFCDTLNWIWAINVTCTCNYLIEPGGLPVRYTLKDNVSSYSWIYQWPIVQEGVIGSIETLPYL